jgi:hypothetical protein
MSTEMLTRIIDGACGPLADLIERSRMPRRMRVHRAAFDAIAAIRAQETADGNPLMLLGMELAPSDLLSRESFEFED